ncbi:hypothetical protein Tsubulata_030051 [Turnera subulata]|uniref:Uncharacterized protein n=1 Tax=Turnera subulata TaxID=218843 RepID=A0A9Q0J9M3_9ROSI|nr:hypothetical protein Tsubulata_030051 [Turnera subulata]
MQDLCNHLSSLNLPYKGDEEFVFWGGKGTHKYKNFSDRTQFEEGDDDCCSPTLWKRDMPRAFNHEASPLLDRRYKNTCTSPRARSQAILEGRREMLEMLRNMPESSYELSLKDMVDEPEASRGGQEELLIQDASFDFNPDGAIEKQKRKRAKKITNSRQISRAGSMEKETFLIKTFVPTSLSWKTKVKTGNGSKVSPRPSFDGSQGHLDKEWWMKRILVSRRSRSSGSSSSSSSSTSSNPKGIIRHGYTSSFRGCCPFFSTRKNMDLHFLQHVPFGIPFGFYKVVCSWPEICLNNSDSLKKMSIISTIYKVLTILKYINNSKRYLYKKLKDLSLNQSFQFKTE